MKKVVKKQIMADLSKSPDRGTFQKDSYVDRMSKEGRLDDPDVQRMIKFYDDWQKRTNELEEDPAWQENNLEFDLRTTRWVIDKCRSEVYAQNLYAALCNQRWQKREIIPILKDEYWTCTWRSAGGIVADLQGKGDYIDWYCTGIGLGMLATEESDEIPPGYVAEGTVTDEVENDMYVLGWTHSAYPANEK